MWYIGQVVQNPAGQRFIYAGFNFDQKPCFSYFRLEGNKLVQFRDDVTRYKELPGRPVPIGLFAQMFSGGFFGEINLAKLQKHPHYHVAVATLKTLS